MSGPGVGFEYPAQPVSWLKRDVLLFANSIGATADELHFLYELHPNFAVFPTYPVILPFKGDTQEVIDFYASQKKIKIPGVPDFDSRRVVDGQRKIEFLKPLPISSEGHKFEIRTKVLGVYDKGRPGSVVDTQLELVDANTNEVYTRLFGSAFYVAQGNWSGGGSPVPSEWRLQPLHATPEPGVKMGFPGAIMHGLYSWNSTAHSILKAVGGSNPANLKEYQARFASPVLPGDKLVIQVWKTGEKKGEFDEIRFVVSVEGGKVCLSNGRALVKIVGDDKGKL
ncbi:hypothetical protein TrVFT333_005355 [Trichoderma virens FT-333]|nr:hypothetical protein TrVFT333_005355 [Trichoderma virens FT-333]